MIEIQSGQLNWEDSCNLHFCVASDACALPAEYMAQRKLEPTKTRILTESSLKPFTLGQDMLLSGRGRSVKGTGIAPMKTEASHMNH